MKNLFLLLALISLSFSGAITTDNRIVITLVSPGHRVPVPCKLVGPKVYVSDGDKTLRVSAAVVESDSADYKIEFLNGSTSKIYKMPRALVGNKTLAEFSALSDEYVLEFAEGTLMNRKDIPEASDGQ